MDGDVEYEFPCFNFTETLTGLWSPEDRRYDDGVYGGVLLRTAIQTRGHFHVLFSRIQACLRKHVNRKSETDVLDLYQWYRGSKYCFGDLEGLIELVKDSENILVKVRGPKDTEKTCFFLLEEILSIIDQVLLEMSPGMAVEKYVLSIADLETHDPEVYAYPSQDIIKAYSSGGDGFNATITNPKSGKTEKILKLICFGCKEVRAPSCVMVVINVQSIYNMFLLCPFLDPEFVEAWH